VSLPRQLGRLAKWSYLVTGSIIWSVFTREITKHQLLVLGHPKGQPGPSMIITGLDEGVHSGITRATILTRRSRGLDSEDDQKLRIKLYIKSDIFKSFVVKEIHSYEVTPGGGDHCLTFKAGWKLTENDELESIVNPS